MEPVINFDVIDERGPQHYEATLELTAEELDRVEIPSGGTASVRVDAQRGDAPGEYAARGEVTFNGELECARCTDPYPFGVQADFTVRYRPLPATEEIGLEAEITSDQLDLEFIEERQIPLRKIAIEQVQLAVPMKPLCDEACQGLCAGCGANRNREECACDTEVTDPRWEGLSALRDQLNRKKEN